MTNQEKTQAVLEAVRNTEGLEHLLEWTNGCMLVKNHLCYQIVNEKAWNGEIGVCDLNKNTYFTIRYDAKGFVTIGHPVQWSDVLVAIDRAGMETNLNGDGQFWVSEKYLDLADTVMYTVDLTRTPEQNMLDNPKLTDFLYELLVTK